MNMRIVDRCRALFAHIRRADVDADAVNEMVADAFATAALFTLLIAGIWIGYGLGLSPETDDLLTPAPKVQSASGM